VEFRLEHYETNGRLEKNDELLNNFKKKSLTAINQNEIFINKYADITLEEG